MQCVSENFHPDLILYLSGGDFFVQCLLIYNLKLLSRFHFIELLNNSLLDKYLKKHFNNSSTGNTELHYNKIAVIFHYLAEN